VSKHPIVLSKACECGSQTGALGSTASARRSLRCAQCNKYIKFVTKAELGTLDLLSGEPVGLPLRRRCLCGNQKGVGVQAGSQWVVRCLKCNIFSHFATEAEVIRSGSALPLSQRTAEAKKAAASKAKAAKVTTFANPLPRSISPTPPQPNTAPVVSIAAPLHTPRQPKAEEARELPQPKGAPVVALAAPIEALTPPMAAPVLALAALVQAPEPAKVAEVRESPEPKVAEMRTAPARELPAPELSPLPPPGRRLAWEEEFVAGVEQELRVMALQRKMVELRNTLTWPLCHWRQR
jgi:hypothetical protein